VGDAEVPEEGVVGGVIKGVAWLGWTSSLTNAHTLRVALDLPGEPFNSKCLDTWFVSRDIYGANSLRLVQFSYP
jgi:hypothetical protein